MKRSLVISFYISIFSPLFLYAAPTITGSPMKIIEISPEASTGLNTIFVVYDTTGCMMEYSGIDGYKATVYRYSNLGGAYGEEIKDIDRNANSLSFGLQKEDTGYIIEQGTSRYYYWIVNYSNHKMTLDEVYPAEDQECDYSVLKIEGDASAITYYTINGQPRNLSRDIYIDYSTQEFNKDYNAFENRDERKIYESIAGNQITISPPAYCPTYFTVSGDRFLREWDMEVFAETGIVQPVAVDSRTEAVQEDFSDENTPSNVMKGDSSGLGGSAPATISFLAYTTDGVIHNEWQMSRDQNFDNPDYRFYQQDLDYTFTEEGNYYLRYIGSNSEGTCETFGDVYTVTIGSSALECPNAFSPNDDGVNDEWKVSYRSLLDFHCEIFNRNGQKIIGFDDPSLGWDGTWHGKKVKPGVYYYVITATGSDGVKYKKSGDINIINSVYYGTGNTPVPEE